MHEMSATLELGMAAIEALEAKEHTRRAKAEYQAQRNSFTAAVPREKWDEYLKDPAFQLCTQKAYFAYRKAKRAQYNAERRMERRYNKVKAVNQEVSR